MDTLQYYNMKNVLKAVGLVLNLVINGYPSILGDNGIINWSMVAGFKPCYKWIPFNTFFISSSSPGTYGFKPCYKWIPFNT